MSNAATKMPFLTRRRALQGLGLGVAFSAVPLDRYMSGHFVKWQFEDRTTVAPPDDGQGSFDLSGTPTLVESETVALELPYTVPDPKPILPTPTTPSIAAPPPVAFSDTAEMRLSPSDLAALDRQSAKTAAQLPATRGLWLVNAHSNEQIATVFWKDGEYNNLAYTKICAMMMDWRENVTMAMDPRLMHLLWAIQRDIGFSDPICITSGFRTIKTNDYLRAEGAAVNSQHLHSRACDITIANTPPQAVALKAQSLKIGGIGFYSRFTHVDTGPIRQWSA